MQNQLRDYTTLCNLLQSIRDFFLQQKILEVMAPPAVTHPGMEPHIHPFGLYDVRSEEKCPYYLHTSPEFFMKHLLSKGMKDIFSLGYCYRSEPESQDHRPQFIMLEWYRAHARYEKIMDDCEQLLHYCYKNLQAKKTTTIPLLNSDQKIKRMTIQHLFQKHLHFDILEFLEKDQLANYLEQNFAHLPLPKTSVDKKDWNWDDYFFLLFLNEIEPALKKYPAIILYEYPFHLSALSTIKASDSRVCERFELYVNGIEIANCFNELTDIHEQKVRFREQQDIKSKVYNYELPEPTQLYQSLERGLPSASGIALGVERLLRALTGIENPFWDKILDT